MLEPWSSKALFCTEPIASMVLATWLLIFLGYDLAMTWRGWDDEDMLLSFIQS